MVRRALVVGLLIALSAPFAAAQTADDLASLRKDIEALKQGQAAVLRELQQIKTSAERGPAGAEGGGRTPFRGDADGRRRAVEG